MENIIQIRGLNKRFGDVQAVRDLSIDVREGDLFAFLGVNGAGKSTTISIICGRLQKDSGSVTVMGENVDSGGDKIKRELGVVFQNSVLDKSLSVKDNLRFRAALYGIFGQEFEARVKELDGLLGINGILPKTVGKLSGGQRRKADIARALIHKPRLLILDEPTTGLDPQTRHTVWEALGELRRNDELTVFLTTHYMEEAADADHIVIIDKGSVCAEGTPHDLKNRYVKDSILIYGASENEIKLLGGEYERFSGGCRIMVSDTSTATGMIVAHPEIFRDYEIIKGRMDDVFINAIGRAPEERE